MLRRLVLLTLFALSTVPAGGCGPGTATIEGDVTVGGKPLEKGTISFVPADGKAAPAAAQIHNGHYTVRTVPGNKVVQISAPVVVGHRKEHNGPGAALVDLLEESLPPKYNTASQLTFDAQAGTNSKDWPVEAKK